MKKIKNIIWAAVLAVGISSVGANTVDAGYSCNAPLVQRSGDYVTYSSWGTGTGIDAYHRVYVIRNGIRYNGPWKAGVGNSTLTLYAPGYSGVPACQVY